MARNFCGTSFAESEPKFNEKLLSHMIYKREKCPDTGKLHWQLAFQSINKSNRTFNGWCKKLNISGKIFKCKGTYKQACDYVRKKETAVGEIKEFGTAEYQGHRNDIVAAVNAASMKDIDADTFVKYHKGIEKYRSLHAKPRNWKTELVILFGKPGSGKSMYMPRDAYWKPPTAKSGQSWWDGYDGEKKVVLDEWKEEYLSREEMLRLTDRYPLKVKISGGYTEFVAETIYITTNQNPWKWYDGDDAWLRRIDFIWCTDHG